MPEDKLIITWDQFHKDCQALADQIKARNKEYAGILAVARGGLPVAGILSQLLDIRDVRTVCLQSYSSDNKQKEIVCTSGCANTYFDDYLVVDDLVDSGDSLSYIQASHNLYLKNFIGGADRDYRNDSAVPYRKSATTFEPTYFVKNIPAERWIVFPWEIN